MRPLYNYAFEYDRIAYHDGNNSNVLNNNIDNDDDSPYDNCNKYFNDYNKISNVLVVLKCFEHDYIIVYHILREP